MRQKTTLLMIFLIVFSLILITNTGYAQRGGTNPTESFETAAYVVQNYFDQTATAHAQRSLLPPEQQTATAEFNLLVQDLYEQALTATMFVSIGNSSAIVGKLATGQAVNVRSCPSTSCQILGTLSPIAEFPILLKEGDWYLIRFPDGVRQGYVYAPLVQLPEGADPSVLPTLTPTPTPTHTPLPPTPTPNIALTATMEALGPLVEPKRDGFYLVGVDILPGKWESQGRGSGCYWARLDQYGDIQSNHFGYAGGTVTILESDFQIQFDGCGTWHYVEGRERVLKADAYDLKNSGFYTVGVEIAPGYWRSTGVGGGCYWERLDEYQDILGNHFGRAGGTIYIGPYDYEVHFNDCGMWEYIGP